MNEPDLMKLLLDAKEGEELEKAGKVVLSELVARMESVLDWCEEDVPAKRREVSKEERDTVGENQKLFLRDVCQLFSLLHAVKVGDKQGMEDGIDWYCLFFRGESLLALLSRLDRRVVADLLFSFLSLRFQSPQLRQRVSTNEADDKVWIYSRSSVRAPSFALL